MQKKSKKVLFLPSVPKNSSESERARPPKKAGTDFPKRSSGIFQTVWKGMQNNAKEIQESIISSFSTQELFLISKRICSYYGLGLSLGVFGTFFVKYCEDNKILKQTVETVLISSSKNQEHHSLLYTISKASIIPSFPLLLASYLVGQNHPIWNVDWTKYGIALNVISSSVLALWYGILPRYNYTNVAVHVILWFQRMKLRRPVPKTR